MNVNILRNLTVQRPYFSRTVSIKSWISSFVVWSMRPGQRFRNSSSVIKGDASNVGCGCVRSLPPGPLADRNHKTRRHPIDNPAEKLPGARILKMWGAKREDVSRLRLRTGSASVRWLLFPTSQPLRPCQLHHFIRQAAARNTEIPEFRLMSEVLRKCTTGWTTAFSQAPRHYQHRRRLVEHTRYNSSRKRRPLNQPATT